MTKLHKLMLDALDQLGDMTRQELETACLIEANQRGGFSSALIRLSDRGFVHMTNDDCQIGITASGVRAVERENMRQVTA